jgi:hypothetical protein
MPCTKKRKAPVTFVQGVDNPRTSDWVPIPKSFPAGCQMIDVKFTLEKRENFYTEVPIPSQDDPMDDRTEENILAASTHTKNATSLQYNANGIAFAVKFVNEEEACPRSIKDFDSLIKVPRVYDVAVVKCSVGNNSRHLYTVGDGTGSSKFLSQEDRTSSKSYNTGYTFGPSGETKRNLDNEIIKNEKFQIHRKQGQDYVISVSQKNVYPAFLRALRQHCGHDETAAMTGHKINLTRSGWYKACQDVEPIWSRYYRWVVDGRQSSGVNLNSDKKQMHTSVDIYETGHYEFEEWNKRYDNLEITPNDVYSDGAIVSLIGLNSLTRPSYQNFDDSWFHLIIYYKLETVKAGVIYLQNIKEFQDLTIFGRQRQSFTDEGEDLTNLQPLDAQKKKGWWEINIFANEGTFYPIDTINVSDSMLRAEGEVFGEGASFTTRTPGYPKNY